jgi:hypothetical protein
MNLDGFARLCHLARNQGVDLWQFQLDNGAGLVRAVAYLAPYVKAPKAWTKRQITPYTPRRRPFLALAAIGLDRADYRKLYVELPVGDSAFSLLVDLLAEM